MPLIAPGLIVLHLPKTGGSSVFEATRTRLGAERYGGQHCPLYCPDHCPEIELDGRQVVATLRDPWSWIGSWYQHGLSVEAHHERMDVYGTDFAAVVRSVCRPAESTTPDRPGIMADIGTRDGLLESGLSLYGYWVRELYAGVHAFLDTAQLPLGLAEVTGTEPQLWADMERANTRFQRGRRFAPVRYLEWYPVDLYDVVAETHAELIDLMGWAGPEEPARSPVVRL